MPGVKSDSVRPGCVSGHPDRVKAIGAVLDVNRYEGDDRLVRWAISQLVKMRHPNADAELNRFAREVEHLANSSDKKPQLEVFREELRSVMAARVNSQQ